MPGYDVQLDWAARDGVCQPCPMCRAAGPHAIHVSVHSPASPAPGAAFYRCRACDGLFAHPFVWPDYADDYGFPDYLRFYVEAGAGLAAMAEPLHRAWRPDMSTMIDVGSGVPFAADFARRMLGLDARSIDPSRYAKAGGEWLGVPVDSALLGGGSTADGKVFDLVYSSEVVEHVESPQAFLDTLARHLSPRGVLVVTTPNADFVSPSRAPLENLGLVWPGIHHALYTPGGLKAAISRAGLGHVRISVERERLVAFASHTPLSPGHGDPASIPSWLKEGAQTAASPALRMGYLYRLFQSEAGHGRRAHALDWLAQLRNAVREGTGQDITDSGAIADAAAALDARAFHEEWPYFAPLMPHLLGSVAMLETGRDLPAATTHFAHQVRICETFRGGDPLWRAEIAHLWASTLFSYGLARLMQRDHGEAVEAFERLLADDAPAGSLSAMGRRDAGLIAQARIQLGSALIQAGRKGEARKALESARVDADAVHHPVIDGLLARCGQS